MSTPPREAFLDARPGPLAPLLDAVRDIRNRWVARPGFRRFAARFPPTRPIARARTRDLFDLAAGFVYSQILSAFVRLGLVELLAEHPRSVEAVAEATGLLPARADRLLRAAAALRLAESRADGRYALGPLGVALVGNEGVTAMVTHHAILYDDLRDPVALLRAPGAGELCRFWDYSPGGGSGVRAYSRLMAASQSFVAEEVLDAVPFDRHTCLMDVGGGSGAFLAAVAARAPKLRLVLFDLPGVAALAETSLAQAGLAGRVAVHGGDVFRTPLPGGADIVTLNRVLHDHDDDDALRILASVRAALEPGGVLVVAEPMAGTPGAEAAGDAYFGFYLLAMGRGRPRSFAETARLMERAGFSGVAPASTATPLIVRVATARA